MRVKFSAHIPSGDQHYTGEQIALCRNLLFHLCRLRFRLLCIPSVMTQRATAASRVVENAQSAGYVRVLLFSHHAKLMSNEILLTRTEKVFAAFV